jgi:heme A synthase
MKSLGIVAIGILACYLSLRLPVAVAHAIIILQIATMTLVAVLIERRI